MSTFCIKMYGIMVILVIILIKAASNLQDFCDCTLGLYGTKTCKIEVDNIDIMWNETCQQYDIISIKTPNCTNDFMRIVFYEGIHCAVNKELYIETFEPGICYDLPAIDNHSLAAKVK